MEQYFIETIQQRLDLEKNIKNNNVNNVITVVLKDSGYIKSFIWFLLKHDIAHKRTAAGAGIAIFHVDTTLTFFLKAKGGANK